MAENIPGITHVPLTFTLQLIAFLATEYLLHSHPQWTWYTSNL